MAPTCSRPGLPWLSQCRVSTGLAKSRRWTRARLTACSGGSWPSSQSTGASAALSSSRICGQLASATTSAVSRAKALRPSAMATGQNRWAMMVHVKTGSIVVGVGHHPTPPFVGISRMRYLPFNEPGGIHSSHSIDGFAVTTHWSCP